MSTKITIRVDDETESIINKNSDMFEGNRTKTICHMIKSYENKNVQGTNLISPQSIAKIDDYLNIIQNKYGDLKDICKEIRRELISNVNVDSIG